MNTYNVQVYASGLVVVWIIVYGMYIFSVIASDCLLLIHTEFWAQADLDHEIIMIPINHHLHFSIQTYSHQLLNRLQEHLGWIITFVIEGCSHAVEHEYFQISSIAC